MAPLHPVWIASLAHAHPDRLNHVLRHASVTTEGGEKSAISLILMRSVIEMTQPSNFDAATSK
jgi:hypothetical protein